MQGMENSFSLIAMWHSMNWVAKGVVIVLALMSIWSLTIAIERLWRFQKAKRESLAVALGVTPLLTQHKLDDSVESGKAAIDRETLMTTAEMKKGLGNLATISTTAPFVGLFGTVAGIIHAFQGMALTGSGGLGAVSAGIAEALVTTAFGLFVAIPAVWLYNYFLNKVDRFQVEMSNSSSQLIDYFIKNEARARVQAAARM